MENSTSYSQLLQMNEELQKEVDRLTEENMRLKYLSEDYVSAREILSSPETEERWKLVMEDEDDPYNKLVKGFEEYYSDDNEFIHI